MLGEERLRHGTGRHSGRPSRLSLSPLLDAAARHPAPQVEERVFDGPPAFQSFRAGRRQAFGLSGVGVVARVGSSLYLSD